MARPLLFIRSSPTPWPPFLTSVLPPHLTPRPGLSTLSCMAGDANGPTGNVPCPSWIWDEPGACPVVPTCGDLTTCSECAMHESCAFCANSNLCMTVEETFYRDCRGVVFDPPCPTSFTPGACPASDHYFCKRKPEPLLNAVMTHAFLPRSLRHYFTLPQRTLSSVIWS